MATRRRRKKRTGSSSEPEPETKPAGTWCGAVDDGKVCGLPQVETPSGLICDERHGGAEALDEEPRNVETKEEASDPGFEVREGDRLIVTYGGSKLSPAQYNTIELDGGTYSRSLREGDDPVEQWDRIWSFIHGRAARRAREKLELYTSELAKAKKKARGDR